MGIAELAKDERGRIIAIAAASPELEAKLREIGFCEGDEVELVARGPFGGQPLALRLNRRTIAIRGEEASAISIERVR